MGRTKTHVMIADELGRVVGFGVAGPGAVLLGMEAIGLRPPPSIRARLIESIHEKKTSL